MHGELESIENVLRNYSGAIKRKVKEISKILNISESKVKTKLYRIRKKLKKELKEGGYGYGK